MSIKNTTENDGTVAQWLHWATALLFLASYCAVYYRHWFTRSQNVRKHAGLSTSPLNRYHDRGDRRPASLLRG